jgi:hypothetical protein
LWLLMTGSNVSIMRASFWPVLRTSSKVVGWLRLRNGANST